MSHQPPSNIPPWLTTSFAQSSTSSNQVSSPTASYNVDLAVVAALNAHWQPQQQQQLSFQYPPLFQPALPSQQQQVQQPRSDTYYRQPWHYPPSTPSSASFLPVYGQYPVLNRDPSNTNISAAPTRMRQSRPRQLAPVSAGGASSANALPVSTYTNNFATTLSSGISNSSHPATLVSNLGPSNSTNLIFPPSKLTNPYVPVAISVAATKRENQMLTQQPTTSCQTGVTTTAVSAKRKRHHFPKNTIGTCVVLLRDPATTPKEQQTMSLETFMRNWLSKNADIDPREVQASHICARGAYTAVFYAFREKKTAARLIALGDDQSPVDGVYIYTAERFLVESAPSVQQRYKPSIGQARNAYEAYDALHFINQRIKADLPSATKPRC